MKKLLLILLLPLLFVQSCKPEKPVISIAVSDDGKYAIAVHDDKNNRNLPKGGQLVLWDIENRKKTILSNNANVFSAFFVPNSHNFMWQDDNDMVHIQNTNGKEIKQFKHVTTFGHIIDAAQSYYVSSDQGWHLFKGYGQDIEKIKYDSKGDYFYGGGKVINLSMGGSFIVSGGAGFTSTDSTKIKYPAVLAEDQLEPHSVYSNVTLWDKNTLKPLANLCGNVAKTYARISPDGNWVVAGDENGHRYIWSTQSYYERVKLLNEDGEGSITPVHSIHFLDHGKSFIVMYHTPKQYLVSFSIFETGVTKSKKMTWIMDDNPRPCVGNYQRNLCIASAPDANILVAGQEYGGGINVYKFNPDKLELETVWIAD